ncbi:hypothetical protein [Streptomyces radicis]|uniref:hypothetical protein n=1 Tax=Streptomyces radicis TaxID=1750517 RepID=UPI001600E998|nr:hypothetical protein [Streptomyces radicis]
MGARALDAHYPRLVRLGYLVLPGSGGRHRRVLSAHAVVQRALPRDALNASGASPALPAQRDGDPGYDRLRQRVLGAALDAARPGRFRRLPKAPHALPRVMGLRLLPRGGEDAELPLEQRLSALTPTARAAYALRRVDGLGEAAVRRLLLAAGVSEQAARAAVKAAAALPDDAPLADPCALTAEPTDLARRRRAGRVALAAGAALALAAGALAVLPEGWGPDGAAAPPYAENEAAEAALDPAALRAVAPDAWRSADRTDFSVWPTRGSALDDAALLRRALAVWARPGQDVSVSATPGTQTGPAPGPAQLLYAGEVGGSSVVLLYDGLRVARYAEPSGAQGGGVALDFARADGADLIGASAVVLGREDGNTRYLTAPWVSEAAMSDLADAADEPADVAIDEDGVTDAVRTGAGTDPARCDAYPVLELTARGADSAYRMADLGELLPALLTLGDPGGAPGAGADAAAREGWARIACHLPALGAGGVRAVNAWEFASLDLPDAAGTGRWLCTRAETWRGTGSKALAQFVPPPTRPGEPGVVTAAAEDTPACGPRDPRVLSGVMWRSPAGSWYLVAGGSEQVVAIEADGEVTGRAEGPTAVLPASEGATADLVGELADGGELPMLG